MSARTTASTLSVFFFDFAIRSVVCGFESVTSSPKVSVMKRYVASQTDEDSMTYLVWGGRRSVIPCTTSGVCVIFWFRRILLFPSRTATWMVFLCTSSPA